MEAFIMTALYVIIAIVVIFAIWALATYNSLIRKRNDCQEGFSTMDVYLKKRADLIPNLVETVKGYAKHEADTLLAVVSARNAASSSKNIAEQVKQENMLTDAVSKLFALSENYPDLKANANFVDLQDKLSQTENDIANARKYYNAVVKQYNNACQTIPSSIIAGVGGFAPAAMFEAAASDRENVKVQF